MRATVRIREGLCANGEKEPALWKAQPNSRSSKRESPEAAGAASGRVLKRRELGVAEEQQEDSDPGAC